MNRSIGERIRTRRKELHITQTQIRDATGISSGNMSGIESGKSLPSASALIELSKILDCSVDWILTGNSPISENVILSNIEEYLLNGFRALSKDDKDELIEILKMKLRKVQKENEIGLGLSRSINTENVNAIG